MAHQTELNYGKGQTENLNPVMPSAKETAKGIRVISDKQLKEVIDQARRTQVEWSKKTLKARASALRRVIEALRFDSETYAEAIHRINGKLVEEALILEILPTLSTLKFFADNAHKHISPEHLSLHSNPVASSTLYYEPLGVIGVISPWNFPFMLSLIDVPAALMAGNSVVIKPSEHCQEIGDFIEQLVRQSGLPDGLVQVVHGDGAVGQKLIEAGIDKICFTGSTRSGHLVYQAAAHAMIPCDLELGGKDAAIVLPDADEKKTAEGVLWGAFANSGQACASIERLYLPKSQKEKWTGLLEEGLKKWKATDIGRMNVGFQKGIVETQLKEATELGMKRLAEASYDVGEDPMRMRPQILTEIPKTSDLFKLETFGPVLPVVLYDDIESVIAEVNSSPYGLTTSIWTRDLRNGELMAKRFQSGVVTINDHMVTAGIPETPWVGHKASGLGFSRSYLSVKNFCKLKYVYHDRGLLKFKFWQAPYDRNTKEFYLKYQEAQFSPSFVKRLYYNLVTLPKLLFGKKPNGPLQKT